MQNVVFTQLSIQELRKLFREEVEKALTERTAPSTTQKTILNFTEGCAYIGISKSHGYKLTSQNLIPFSKRGKRIYFDKSELDKWLLANKSKDVSSLETETNEYLSRKNK